MGYIIKMQRVSASYKSTLARLHCSGGFPKRALAACCQSSVNPPRCSATSREHVIKVRAVALGGVNRREAVYWLCTVLLPNCRFENDMLLVVRGRRCH